MAEDDEPTRAQQNAIVQLVHRRGKPVYTHAAFVSDYEQAIVSKCDGIQHIPSDGVLASEQVSRILSQGQFVTPTMELYRILFANPGLYAALGGNSSDNLCECPAKMLPLYIRPEYRSRWGRMRLGASLASSTTLSA